MAARIISNPARVYAYVASLMPMQMTEGMKGLGLEKGGELVAGVLYEGFNPYNVWMHVASHTPGAWLNRRFLWACFYYPFVEVGVKRVGVHVADSNTASRAFVDRLGFEREATVKGAAMDGGDIGMYVMWRDNCRFIGERYGKTV